MRGYQAGMCSSELASTCGADVPKPVQIRKSLFFNSDSIAYYASIAAREDDPRALFVAGMAAHLRAADPDYCAFLDSLSTSERGFGGCLPSLDEADHYLLRAAELGSEDAITYIRCLSTHGQWDHFVPSANK